MSGFHASRSRQNRSLRTPPLATWPQRDNMSIMKKEANAKIRSLGEIGRIASKLKAEGKKIVQCHGVFDLIHPGHIRHFASAKKHGDVLIVTVTADQFVKKGPGRPFFNQQLRSEVLAAIVDVDFVAIVHSDSAVDAIQKIKPDVFVKGPDYRSRKVYKDIPRKLDIEAQTVNKAGGKVIFTEDEIIFSSTKLINDYLETYPPETKKYLEEFKKKYSAEYILDKLEKLKSLKVFVIGEAIIDQYHYCLPVGRSSKEPIMVHQYMSEESFSGGILATSNHISALISNVTLFSVLGRTKSFEPFIRKHLKAAVHPLFFYHPTAPTIIKRRFLDVNSNQKLFQVTYMDDNFIPEKMEKQMISYLKEHLRDFDLVVVNDFGHGMMTPKIVRVLSKYAKFLCLNVQSNSSNYGFNLITKYPRADFVCIDDLEIRLASHDKKGELSQLIRKIYRRMKCREVIVTKGAYGSISYNAKDGIVTTPSLTQNVVDRVGAGDALFAITSGCVYADLPHDVVTFLGNVAGALQVQIMGNKTPIEFSDMAKYITRLLK